MDLRKLPRGKACVCCGAQDETVVGAHYTGIRRGAYGGGLGIKAHDLLMADLCGTCHGGMDTLSRDKANAIEHSERMQHFILLTIVRRFEDGAFVAV